MGYESKPKPNYLWSMLTMRCPRCRRGDMFRNKNGYKKLKLSYILDMYEQCPVCRQQFDLEPGFWFGTGFVSYGLTILLSATTFVAWWLIVGISVSDNRIFYWLAANAVLLIVLQPWLMRLSRSIYIYFFIRYDADYEKTESIRLYQ